MILDDTIAAISSAVGPAVRMIVRVSGPGSFDILQKLTAAFNTGAASISPSPGNPGEGRGEGDSELGATSAIPDHPNPFPDYRERGSGGAPVSSDRCAARRNLHFANLVLPAWVYTFVAPASYSGQDQIELHIPGNPLLARMLLDAIVSHGARLAEPGEFTARAWFNGKIDLSQAEGVAAAISATSAAHLSAAQRLLAGELSRRLRPVMDLIGETLGLVEVGIDFSEEDVQFLSADEVQSRINRACDALDDLTSNSARFEKLSHEPQVVLAGRPNAGKSTLLNVLAGQSRAVVSPVAGTTRDVLSAPITLKRGVIRLQDVAGLEESPENSAPGLTGNIENQMRLRALRAIETADAVILMRDINDPRPPLQLPRRADLTVRTKIDLSPAHQEAENELAVSATAGTNLDLLKATLDKIAFGSESPGSSLALTTRHLQAIAQARLMLNDASASVETGAAELVAADLRATLDTLGTILGAVTPDDILGRIFSTFCIGK